MFHAGARRCHTRWFRRGPPGRSRDVVGSALLITITAASTAATALPPSLTYPHTLRAITGSRSNVTSLWDNPIVLSAATPAIRQRRGKHVRIRPYTLLTGSARRVKPP